MLHATPFLLFDGNCAEAMTFYHKCLGGELRLTKLGDTPMKDMFPPEKHERLINAYLKSGDIELSATDWMASPSVDPVQGNTKTIPGYKNCTKCHLVPMDSFMTSTASSGYLEGISPRE